MPQVDKITTILDNVFYQMSASYSFSVASLQVLLLCLTFIRQFAIPSYEPSNYNLVSAIMNRMVGLVGFGALYIISKRCKINFLMTFIYVALPILEFEVNVFTMSYGDAYIVYALFYNSFREIILLNMNTRVVYILEGINIVYHIIRAIIFKSQLKIFSIFVFCNYLLSYVFANIPIINNYITVKENIHNYEKLRHDFENLLYALPIPMFKFKLNNRLIELVNEDFKSLLTSMKIEKHEFMDILSQNTEIFESINKNIICNSFILHYNQSEYSIKYRKLEENDGNIYVACIQDVSMVKEVESLKAKETYKQMFISVINHQLRTPLNGVYGPLNIIKEKKLCSEADEYLDLAINSLDIMTALIDDTIAFSECCNNKMKLNPTNGNILVELQKLKKMFSFESDQKDVSFHLSINLKRYNINADIKKINQILIILVSNAFKYTYKGAISVHCEEQNKMLKFEVSDTGIGIKEENLPQLFHEFSSPDRVNKEKSTSSGFQLALIKKLVTLMGGDIYVQSTFGEGTIFSLLLKVEWIAINKSITENLLEREITENIDAGKVAPRQSSELKFIQMLTNHKTTAEIIIIPDTILIVDDNCANIFVLQRMLNMLKIKSEKAMNGLECVKKVSERGINGYIMILMDINMPIMNGFEATKALNKLKLEGKISNTPIIAVTAQSETSMIEQCKQLGINKCVFKPVKMVELKELIAEYKVKEYTNSNFDYDK